MADTAIHSFTEKTALAATDEFYIVQSTYAAGDDRRVALSSIGTYFAKSTLAAGTLTDSAPCTITQTWNDAADAFIGFSVDITSTNSAAASLPFRVRVGGSNVFDVNKTGDATLASAIVGVTVADGDDGDGAVRALVQVSPALTDSYHDAFTRDIGVIGRNRPANLKVFVGVEDVAGGHLVPGFSIH